MNCPFCEIEKESERILFTGTHARVILSNPRLVDGHLLVIPRRHVEKLSELDQLEQADLMQTTIRFQEKILEKFASGCDLRQHYRPFIAQNGFKVNHLHIHLQPRELEDELYTKVQSRERDVFRPLDDDERKKFLKMFSE